MKDSTANNFAQLPPAAQQLVQLLQLEPLPEEGGLFRNTLATQHSSAIYYLLAGADFSALHELHATEVYHWYAGSPLNILVLHPDGAGENIVVGNPLEGYLPQAVIPAHSIHGSRSQGDWTLVGTTMAPAFSWEGFRLVPRQEALLSHPNFAAAITSLTRV